ncbi:DUF1553 domain-containing protein [Rubinisphaera italica]|uniref:Planctomycete cytochrome C n=1 Tax=Rubinisphaera italica TaxID=2527969 RepID=A0A5C5XE13_9PLAN|nr:DUF1553 domain-containing protein [Rubinisphaera italica]TWT60543.1 Planctomycete cytochrome C [Rubinisphaera italica]
MQYVIYRFLTLFLLLPAASVLAESPTRVDFNRDIRPILSNKCFACHGPDSQDRDADFRLDTSEGAFKDLGGYAGIVPGDPDTSELVLRINNDDPDMRMPPPEHKNPLEPEEIDLLTRWIREGAEYSGHWAFEPVQRPVPPSATAKIEGPIDQFIAARLAEEELHFSPEATPETLVRRLYLDLTNLPPTLAEVEAFLQNPDAQYEATIDRLMDSPQFAERLAMDWLDVARFADTNGYSIDDHRDMWVWRDWVIKAFQNNMPYDEFLRQQLAGDLMENATEDQLIATGFLRNSMNTHEGGTIAEEYRVASIVDKIDTVSTAFMGLTMRCAQCHDHKYDPISQKDYYQFFAFFNTSTETGRGGKNGNTKPMISVDPILPDEIQFRASLEERIAALQLAKAYPENLLGDARLKWEKETLAKFDKQALVEMTQPFRVPVQGEAEELSWIWSNPQAAGEFAWFRKTFNLEEIPSKADLMVSCDNEAEIWVNGKLLGKNPDWRTPTVFNLQPLLVTGENLIAVAAKDWTEGGGKAALLSLAVFNDNEFLATDSTWLVSSLAPEGWNLPGEIKGFLPASVVAAHGSPPWGDVFAKLDATDEHHIPSALIVALRKPDLERSQEEQDLVAAEFAKVNVDMQKLLNTIDGEIELLRQSHASGKTSVMVMDRGAADRKTPILERGQYDQHGEIVEAGVPEFLGALPESMPADRLALANWLTDPAHPLTARVTVNRYWQLLFGTGIVKTTEDFGSQGEWPSHPELLDWLAAEFVESGWDVRALLKQMLMSRTYRQSSNIDGHLLEVDPYNRLYARAPRYRLSAEAVRDSSLAIAGLLNQEIGGPSVYPPQPVGLWKEVSHFGYGGFFSAQHYFTDTGRLKYRRSLYTFWKRTSPPPVMTTFDAPNRETCSVRRSLTNTPLQALVLMNAPQFVEASRGLAERMIDASDLLDEQLRYGFRLATARRPSKREMKILKSTFQQQSSYFEASPEKTVDYLGADYGAGGVEATHVAAIRCVASLILNLDETITRE